MVQKALKRKSLYDYIVMAKPRDVANRIMDPRRLLSYQIVYSKTLFKTAAILFIIILAMIGFLIATILHRDFVSKLENLEGLLLSIMGVMYALNQRVLSRRKVDRIYDYLIKSTTATRYGLTEEVDTMNRARASTDRIVSFSSAVIVANLPLMLLMAPLMAAIGGKSWKQLPFPWPIPEANYWTFYSSVLIQYLSVLFVHIIAVSETAVMTLTRPVSAVFDVVILGLNRIEERAAEKMSEEGLTYQESMLSCLRESIAHHQEIVDELLLVKPYMEITFFAQVMFISTVIACEAYPVLMVDLDLIHVIKGIWFVIVLMVCCGIFNYEMDVMSNKNVEVFDALYNTPWYACDIKFRRMVLNGMTFSQNPIWINGMGLLGVKASRATFYSAMVSSYNILNMFRNTG